MNQRFKKIENVSGTLILPGDKSISHRAVMLSAMAEGESILYNCLLSEDVITTISVFREMGIKIDIEEDKIIVWGNGFNGLTEPDKNLYLGNSGTTTRLLAGILAAQKFPTTLIGDESLSTRPMKRIITPLRQMGANISGENNCLPLIIKPTEYLRPIHYELPIASAQVKSCILLAGLFIDEETVVIESKETRDHTERMLGLKVVEDEHGKSIYSSMDYYPIAAEYKIPSDISTAGFFMVLASLVEGSELVIKNVSVNETRTGVIAVLEAMGANITAENVTEINGEVRGDLIIKSSELTNVEFDDEIIPNIIDEIPILAIAGVLAKGDFDISGVEELRTKESDRINSMCRNFELLGLNVDERKDGFSVSGHITNYSAVLNSYGDHRIAMAFSILASIIHGEFTIDNFDCVSVSNPNFLKQLESISK
ncbi:MAG: 3-phosphoshikimate 1-carboxyvinyltransferase [Ignavibacteriae bacterium]|nr:3-phosphoshikimate 1-carboxyvinyltransferase [Ignavibacteriota bacterium]